MTYKWQTPHEWLAERIYNATGEEGHEWLVQTALELMHAHDADTIQDLFQREMEEDGYFKEKEKYWRVAFHADDPDLEEQNPVWGVAKTEEESKAVELLRAHLAWECGLDESRLTWLESSADGEEYIDLLVWAGGNVWA